MDIADDNYQRALKLVTQSQLPTDQQKRLVGLLTHLRNPYADDLYFNKDAVLWVRQFLGRPGYEWLNAPDNWTQGEPPLLAHLRDRFAALHPRSSDTIVLSEMQAIDLLLEEGNRFINLEVAKTSPGEAKVDVLYEAIMNWIATQEKDPKSLYYAWSYGTGP